MSPSPYNSIAKAAITPLNIVAPLTYPAAAAPLKTLGFALLVAVTVRLLTGEVGRTIALPDGDAEQGAVT
jgi:formate hydrogenlyase subunit 3/multisubunit Na+/H+ antiporter MnhD subunit